MKCQQLNLRSVHFIQDSYVCLCLLSHHRSTPATHICVTASPQVRVLCCETNQAFTCGEPSVFSLASLSASADTYVYTLRTKSFSSLSSEMVCSTSLMARTAQPYGRRYWTCGGPFLLSFSSIRPVTRSVCVT